jgi:hypothetical protein
MPTNLRSIKSRLPAIRVILRVSRRRRRRPLTRRHQRRHHRTRIERCCCIVNDILIDVVIDSEHRVQRVPRLCLQSNKNHPCQ